MYASLVLQCIYVIRNWPFLAMQLFIFAGKYAHKVIGGNKYLSSSLTALCHSTMWYHDDAFHLIARWYAIVFTSHICIFIVRSSVFHLNDIHHCFKAIPSNKLTFIVISCFQAQRQFDASTVCTIGTHICWKYYIFKQMKCSNICAFVKITHHQRCIHVLTISCG